LGSSSEEGELAIFVFLLRELSRISLEERCTVVENEELMQYSMYYSRWLPQDFVTGGNDTNAVIYYLRAERDFEILKLTSFVTTNLFNFEKIKVSRVKSHPFPPSDSTGKPFHPDHHE